MTLTVISALNGPSPQFTLICISTGGPATTVTWTRDSVTVTEGTETVLDDSETSQYSHTLTGSTAGVYTCTVANNKPSNDSVSYSVEGTKWMSLLFFVCPKCAYRVIASKLSYAWILWLFDSLLCFWSVFIYNTPALLK